MTHFFSSLCHSRELIDTLTPCSPYYLVAENLFSKSNKREIFIKKIYSTLPHLPKRGSVVMAPGIATNANLYRVSVNGDCLCLNHNESFANLLASEGFTVFLYHPTYTERVYNRYVCRHCKESRYYQKIYKVPSTLTFTELANEELPQLIDFIQDHTGDESLSWIGYSMGGMLIYSYLMSNLNTCVQNVITIASPITFNQIFIQIFPFINWASKALGLEEKTVLGSLAEQLVPITRLIRNLPGWLVRYNALSPFLCNPLNISGTAAKTLLGKIVEPIPSSLENCFSDFISKGFPSAQNHSFYYLKEMRRIRELNKRFLFFYGPYDVLAPPDSVFLAHEIISPDYPNFIKVPSAGHVDIIIGKNSREYVWLPIIEWLKDHEI